MNIELTDLALVFLVITALGYWWHLMGIRNLALMLSKSHCKKLGLQLLDESLVMKKIRLKRADSGSIQVARVYGFEFTSTGSQRYSGEIALLGKSLLGFELSAYEVPHEEETDALESGQ